MQKAALVAGLVGNAHLDFAEATGRLAAQTVAPTVAERARERRFDRDLWRRLAAAGLVGAMVPVDKGGAGRDARSLLLALDAFVEQGHDLGLAVSLNVHNQLLRYLFLEHATPEQQERYLPALLSGEKLVCLAASEPETGAHPRHLRTTAELHGDTYRLTGEKAYITNGPESDLMIVIAVTDDSGPKRGISALLVERDWAGVEVSEPMDLGFLRTSPHARVQFTDTPVPARNLIGPKDDAWSALVRGFRDHEDAFGCGISCGLLAWQLHETLVGEPGAGAAEHSEIAMGIAEAQSALAAARLTALSLAALRDAGEATEDAAGTLLDASGDAFRRGLAAIDRAWDPYTVGEDAPISLARREAGVTNIAGRARRIRRAQRGARLAQAARQS